VADDPELLEQIGHGDHAAFKMLLDRHARYLFGIAHSLTNNASDAEDLIQETFAAVLNAKFRGESSVRTWLVRILVNRAALLRRSRHRGSSHLKIASEQMPVEQRSESSGVDAKLDLSAMLEQLSEEHRQVIILRELQGMSYEEMAQALDVPRGTIESRLHRAREELRKRFKGYS
jgi:RNA polymerase sigma-70 factor (ECF subfamily)